MRRALRVTRQLRYQIAIPYLLLAAIGAAGGVYLLTHAASQSLHARFNQQLLDAARGGANSLAGAEVQQIAGLRAIVYTEGFLPAFLHAQQTGDAAGLQALIAPLALNNGWDEVVVAAAGRPAPLLDLRQALGDRAPAPVPDLAGPLVPAGWLPAVGQPGALDKVSALAEAHGREVFYTAGPVRQGTQVIGGVLVGTELSQVLRQVTRDSLSQGAHFYSPDGQPRGAVLAGQDPGAALPPPLPAGWAADLLGNPTAPARFRTLSLAGGTYIEALAAVPGRGSAGAPGIYGVVLSPQTLDAGLQDSLWTLVPLIGLGLLLILLLGSALAARIDRPLRQLMAATDEVAHGNLDVQVPVTRDDDVGVLTRRFNDMVIGLRQTLQIKDLFGRFVSPEVSAQLLDGQIRLGGERRTVTILFSDLRDFTQLSEDHAPEQIVELLNDYFQAVVAAAHQHGGTVNKFGGDSTLIIFGAPVAAPNAADRALATALAMRSALETINARRVRDGWGPLRQGIGINTGVVVAGQIGAEARMEYTVIGAAVNLAARIQGLVKSLPDCDIAFSESTRVALADSSRWAWADRGAIQLRGRREPVQIYSLNRPVPLDGAGAAGMEAPAEPDRSAVDGVTALRRGTS